MIIHGVSRKKTNSVDEDKAEITFGNYEAVKVFVNDAIIDRCNAVSMRKLLELYGTGFGQENEKKYRNKLKMKLVKEFGDSLTFLKIDGNKPKVVVTTAGLDSTAVVKEKTAVLKQAAEYIREDILQYAEKLNNPSWPPTSDSLTDQEKDYPSVLNEFFTFLLKSKDRPCTDSVKRLIHLYGSDLIHSVTHGKVITLKHFLLGLGLHNITGLKLPITILSHLGHCINHNLVCEVETAEAEVAEELYKKTTGVHLQPSNTSTLAYWWVDNFNQTLDSSTGHGVINSTHIVEFSEPSGHTVIDILRENRPRTKRRSFVPSFDSTLPAINVDKKKEPVISSAQVPAPISRAIQEDTECFQIWYFIWLLSRTLSAKDQVVSVFSGWTINVQKNFDGIEKAILTYLPPINSPITEFSTIYEIFEIVQKRAVKRNIKYANITFDIGAAMNACKVLWNYPDKFKNIVIHLGDFHFIKEVFAILGKLISGSGFEDVIFQAGLCSAGSLNGVVAGSHYNRCWFVHGHLAETLERLLFERFLTTIDSIPDILKD